MLRRGLRILLSFLLAATFLGLFAWKLDFAKILDHIGDAQPLWLGAAVLFQGLHLTLRSLRWRKLLAPMKPNVGFYNLFATTAIGYLVSFVLFRIGEVLRPMMLGQRERISKSGALATCVLERLMDFLSVAFLLGVYLVFFFDPPAAAAGASFMRQVRGAGLVLGIGTFAIFPLLYLLVHYRHRLFDALTRRSSGPEPLLPRLLHSFLGGFDAVKGGKVFALAWLESIAIWVVITGSIWSSLKAFDIELGFSNCLLLMAMLTIGIAVPTPGGVGSYEYFGQLALTQVFGVDPNRAAATILVTHAFAIAPVMLIGTVLLYKEGLSFRSLSQFAREAPQGMDDSGPGGDPSAERASARTAGASQ
jgi:glycosyltransferase 2 family protein